VAASERLEARRPDAQIWVVRVGSRYVRQYGFGSGFLPLVGMSLLDSYEVTLLASPGGTVTIQRP
jgi:hypothetical protein